MGGTYFLFPALIVILVSFLVVRAAAIALRMTGLDEKRAKFQALSAFSGTGFTTKEAESVVNHPARRSIVTWLMIIGNAGIVTVIVTTTSSFVTSKGYQLPISALVLLGGIYLIYKVVTNRRLARRWESFIENKLLKTPTFEEAATEDLLHLLEGYGLVRAIIREDSPLISRSLLACKLTEKGLLVLGIERGNDWIPTPKAKETLEEGDRVVIYGRLDFLRSLFSKE